MSALLDDNVGFDEPASEAPTGTDQRNTAAITTDLGRVQNSLTEFDRVSAGLADLAARYPKGAVYDVTTTKGMKDAIEHRAAWRDPRILVEKARRMAKSPLLQLGKSIDARAAWITAELEKGELPVDAQIKAEEARKERERQERINAEAGRILAIQEALADIAVSVQAACGKTPKDIADLLASMQATEPSQSVFQEMLDAARAAWSAGITKLETAHKAKLWDEEQAQQRAAAEAQRRAEQEAADAERARIAVEQKVEADRLAAERAEIARERAELAALKKAAEPAPAPALVVDASAVAATVQVEATTLTDAERTFTPEEPTALPRDPRDALICDVLSLISFLRNPMTGKFASHPKVGPAWWSDLRTKLDSLEPRVAAEIGIRP